MATLKRSHAPVPWGAQVETMIWTRSQRGAPKRRRSDRPPLTHDAGWDWDETRVLFSDEGVTPDEECCEVRKPQAWEDEYSPALSERTHATLSLLDIARYQVTRRRNRGRFSPDDFEIVRIPKVIPISEVPGLGDGWKLDEWERLEELGFKRTYSEVARGLVDGEDPSNTPGYSRVAAGGTQDDPWVYL